MGRPCIEGILATAFYVNDMDAAHGFCDGGWAWQLQVAIFTGQTLLRRRPSTAKQTTNLSASLDLERAVISSMLTGDRGRGLKSDVAGEWITLAQFAFCLIDDVGDHVTRVCRLTHWNERYGPAPWHTVLAHS